MSSLKQYLEIQRQENETLKLEIESHLEYLLHPLDVPMTMLMESPLKYSNFITELCQFEQKVNHKLTEINFDLKKFSKQEKFPEYKLPVVATSASENQLDDIEKLKQLSSILISKLDKLNEVNIKEETNFECVESSEVSETCLKNEKKEISQSSLEIKNELCDHSNSSNNNFQNSDKTMQLYKTDIEKFTDHYSVDSQNENVEQNNLESSYSEDDLFDECEINFETNSNISQKVETSNDFVLSHCFHNDKTTDQGGGVELKIADIKTEQSTENSAETEVGNQNEELQESKVEITEFMWKNVTELNTNKCMSWPLDTSTIKKERLNNEENECDDEKIESELTLLNSVTSESEFSCELGSDSEISSDSRYLQSQKVKLPKINYDNAEGVESSLQKFSKINFENDENFIADTSSNGEESLSIPNFQFSSLMNSTADGWGYENLMENRSFFSAEQKIKKLGLDDRRTLFEKTRQVASLPDLSLKPMEISATDHQKLKWKKSEKKIKLEMAQSEQPTTGMICVFSHVESPSEFYLHPNTEETKLIDSLNDLLTEQYKTTKSPYNSKTMALQHIGQFCCAYLKDFKMYYRVEILDWFLELNNNYLKVQLVDYGNYQVVHYKNLRPLDYQFSLLPKLAIRCYLPFLYPPGSTRTERLTEWPMSSIEALFDLSGLGVDKNQTLFRLVHVERDNINYAVDLYPIAISETETVGQLLIDLGHVVQLIFPEDDPMGVLMDEDNINDLENCDNLNEVILGYDPKDESRICKFTTKDGGRCFKRSCKLEHAQFTRDGFTTDQTLTYTEALNDLILPKVGEFTAIRFTNFVDATKFYGNIMNYVEDLRHLEVVMNDYSNCSKFVPFKILPARGEIVAVNHWQKRWLRAKVKHHLFNENGECTGAQVFMVDYGDTIDARMENIRQIRKEYLNLPFQAIECEMYNYKESTSYERREMDKFFYQNMVFRVFSAKVIACGDLQLSLEFYHKNAELGDYLTEFGFLQKAVGNNVYPHPNSLLIPG